MELWWNLDILWWNLDRFEHKFDGNITNWPCWSEGKLGTGPFTWLGQGFHTNFLEIPFQTGEKRHFDGLSIARKIGFMLTPVFCNASRNMDVICFGDSGCISLTCWTTLRTWKLVVNDTVDGKDNLEEKTREVSKIRMYHLSWVFPHLGCDMLWWCWLTSIFSHISDNI